MWHFIILRQPILNLIHKYIPIFKILELVKKWSEKLSLGMAD
jgi:hypothetical protein